MKFQSKIFVKSLYCYFVKFERGYFMSGMGRGMPICAPALGCTATKRQENRGQVYKKKGFDMKSQRHRMPELRRDIAARHGPVARCAATLAVCLLTAATLAAGSSYAQAAGKKPFGDCVVAKNPPIHKLQPVHPGALTVAASFPYPEGYRGNTLDTIDGGYMYCLDAAIANRAGLDKINLVNATFESLVTAKTSDFDIAVWDIIDTAKRRKVVDFAAPYGFYETGVLAKAGSKIDKHSIKKATVGVLAGSTTLHFVQEKLKPKTVRAFANDQDMFNSLLSGGIDVAMNDIPIVMPAAKKSKGRLTVIARYPELAGAVAPLLPKGSPNVEPVSQIIKDMKKDGSLHAIMAKWLYPLLGGDPNKVPVWKSSE